MFIFAEPGQIYIRNGLRWVVDAIEGNLVKSLSTDYDIKDIEVLKKFNKEVIAGDITFPDDSISASSLDLEVN